MSPLSAARLAVYSLGPLSARQEVVDVCGVWWNSFVLQAWYSTSGRANAALRTPAKNHSPQSCPVPMGNLGLSLGINRAAGESRSTAFDFVLQGKERYAPPLDDPDQRPSSYNNNRRDFCRSQFLSSVDFTANCWNENKERCFMFTFILWMCPSVRHVTIHVLGSANLIYYQSLFWSRCVFFFFSPLFFYFHHFAKLQAWHFRKGSSLGWFFTVVCICPAATPCVKSRMEKKKQKQKPPNKGGRQQQWIMFRAWAHTCLLAYRGAENSEASQRPYCVG